MLTIPVDVSIKEELIDVATESINFMITQNLKMILFKVPRMVLNGSLVMMKTNTFAKKKKTFAVLSQKITFLWW